MPERIERDVVAIIGFEAINEATGEVIERVPQVAYLHGHDNFPKGLEDALEGKGAQADFDVAVADAFGVATGAEQSVRKGDLPKNIRDNVRPGLNFAAEGSDGKRVVLWVKEAKGGRVTITPDHPYAGLTLRFVGRVYQLRQPTAGELHHGHAHGVGGEEHH
jgi:FKBP-type peptidyl-prolyl cis-trans isomerase SlyD